VLLNGIDDLAPRSDLLDRTVTLRLPVIRDDVRRAEAELWAAFEEARPRILGALLDAVSAALRNQAHVHLEEKPRMADFAIWATAAEPALGWRPGAFMAAYLSNRGAANAVALEESVLAMAVLRLMHLQVAWDGTAGELLRHLNRHFSDPQIRRHRDWPKGPRKLSGELHRWAPSLRQVGVESIFGAREGGTGRRLIVIRKSLEPDVTAIRESFFSPQAL
jgi:putative DNA primase/helicase